MSRSALIPSLLLTLGSALFFTTSVYALGKMPENPEEEKQLMEHFDLQLKQKKQYTDRKENGDNLKNAKPSPVQQALAAHTRPKLKPQPVESAPEVPTPWTTLILWTVLILALISLGLYLIHLKLVKPPDSAYSPADS